jgi:hypothetical protein
MKYNLIDSIERQELVQKLIDNGYGKLVEALLYSDGKTFTKKNRLNKSGACRVLGWKTKQLEDALEECRRILGHEILG